MKIIVGHTMPDLDVGASVWLIKRFMPGWGDAKLEFVPAGDRIMGAKPGNQVKNPIENIEGNEVIHVDTGMGPLDHHQTNEQSVCAASLAKDFVFAQNEMFSGASDKVRDKKEAIARLINVVVEDDHFKDSLYPDANADHYLFLLRGVLDGLKLEKPNDDEYYINFMMECFDALLHSFENKVWAEKEIKDNSQTFETKWGKGLAVETVNDETIRVAQKMGYVLVVRHDPRKKYLRIKARPDSEVDLTKAYERFLKMDPKATWFLHVSKKMLLNGGTKNPKMKPTSLPLSAIIGVLREG